MQVQILPLQKEFINHHQSTRTNILDVSCQFLSITFQKGKPSLIFLVLIFVWKGFNLAVIWFVIMLCKFNMLWECSCIVYGSKVYWWNLGLWIRGLWIQIPGSAISCLCGHNMQRCAWLVQSKWPIAGSGRNSYFAGRKEYGLAVWKHGFQSRLLCKSLGKWIASVFSSI